MKDISQSSQDFATTPYDEKNWHRYSNVWQEVQYVTDTRRSVLSCVPLQIFQTANLIYIFLSLPEGMPPSCHSRVPYGLDYGTESSYMNFCDIFSHRYVPPRPGQPLL